MNDKYDRNIKFYHYIHKYKIFVYATDLNRYLMLIIYGYIYVIDHLFASCIKNYAKF